MLGNQIYYDDAVGQPNSSVSYLLPGHLLLAPQRHKSVPQFVIALDYFLLILGMKLS